MRTFEEIKHEVARIQSTSMFGFGVEAMMEFLTYGEADMLGLLKPEAERPDTAAADWAKHVKPRDEASVLAAIRTYMLTYGFEKAIDHRGLSAGRTVEKMRGLTWLLGGHEELLAFIDGEGNYTNYGVPILKRVAKEFDIPIPDEIERWPDGGPCEPGCDQGCGR